MNGDEEENEAMFHNFTYVREHSTDAIRANYSPRDGLVLAHDSYYTLLTGAAGGVYNLLRVLPHNNPSADMGNTTLSMGIYRGTSELEARAALHVPFSECPPVESFSAASDGPSIAYRGASFLIETDGEEFHWQDGKGRVDIRGRRLGLIHELYVPVQPGLASSVVWHDYMAKVSGTIDDDAVEGVFHDTRIFGAPGLTYSELKWTALLENYWLDWLVEYEDGSLEGGFAMKGHPEAPYATAHHVVNGKSTVRTDARIAIDRTPQGTMKQVRLSLGSDLAIVCDQQGSFDRPIHTYGIVTSISRDKPVVKSWNYTENWPRNWAKVEAFQQAHASLYGRYPSLKKILDSARWHDEYLVFD